MLTLKKINAELQKKYPGIELVRGQGYFYVYSEDDDLGLKLAGLYTTSIPVDKLNQMTMEKWIEAVEYVLKDMQRLPYARCPVFDIK